MPEKIGRTYLLVFLPVKPEYKGEFRTRLGEMGQHIAKEPQFVSASIHEDQNDPDTLVLWEIWDASKDDLGEQLQRPYRAEYEELLTTWLRSERTIHILSAPIGTVDQQLA